MIGLPIDVIEAQLKQTMRILYKIDWLKFNK